MAQTVDCSSRTVEGWDTETVPPPTGHSELGYPGSAGCYSSKRRLDLAQKDRPAQDLYQVGLEMMSDVGWKPVERAQPGDSLRGLNIEQVPV